jgi:hypothetical protein
MESQLKEKNKTLNALSATMVIARTPMRLCFVMVVTLLFTKSVTVFHLYPRANGFVGGVNWSGVAHLPVSYQ